MQSSSIPAEQIQAVRTQCRYNCSNCAESSRPLMQGQAWLHSAPRSAGKAPNPSASETVAECSSSCFYIFLTPSFSEFVKKRRCKSALAGILSHSQPFAHDLMALDAPNENRIYITASSCYNLLTKMVNALKQKKGADIRRWEFGCYTKMPERKSSFLQSTCILGDTRKR